MRGCDQKPTREELWFISKTQGTRNIHRANVQIDLYNLSKILQQVKTPRDIKSRRFNSSLERGSDVFLPDGFQFFSFGLVLGILRTRWALLYLAIRYFSALLLQGEQAERCWTAFLHPQPPRAFIPGFFFSNDGFSGAL